MVETPAQARYREEQRRRREAAKPSTALELKQQEYRTFATQYVAPIVKSAPSKEAVPDIFTVVGLIKAGKTEEAQRVAAETRGVLTTEQYLKGAFQYGGIAAVVAATKTLPKDITSETLLMMPKDYTSQMWKPEPQKPKGVAQQILEFDVFTFFADVFKLKGQKRQKYLAYGEAVTGVMEVTPLVGIPTETLAGIVAYPESLAHAGMTWLGIEPPTRPIPSLEVSKSYTMGYAMGLVGTSLLASKAIEPIIRPIVAPIEKAVSSVWKGSRPEMWLIKHSSWYATKAAKGLVPQVVGAKGASEVFSMKTAEAAEMAWMLETTPKTSALTVSATEYLIHKTTVLPHLISRAGVVSIGYLREMGFERPQIKGGLSVSYPYAFETVTKVAPKTIPYLPSFPTAITGPSFASQAVANIFGFSLAALSKPTLPKITVKPIATSKAASIVTPKLEPKIKPFTRKDIFPFVSPISTPVVKAVPEVAAVQAQYAKVAQSVKAVQQQVSALKVKTAQMTVQVPDMPKISVTKTAPAFPAMPTYRLPPKPKKGKRKDLFGAWFKREHPIKLPKQMLRTYMSPKMPKVGGKKR